MNCNVEIRKAERQDVPLLLEFIRGIARYEKMENEVVASADVLEREMFDEHRAEAVFAVVDGREVGFALYFYLSLGAVPMKEWTVYRLDADTLDGLSVD